VRKANLKVVNAPQCGDDFGETDTAHICYCDTSRQARSRAPDGGAAPIEKRLARARARPGRRASPVTPPDITATDRGRQYEDQSCNRRELTNLRLGRRRGRHSRAQQCAHGPCSGRSKPMMFFFCCRPLMISKPPAPPPPHWRIDLKPRKRPDKGARLFFDADVHRPRHQGACKISSRSVTNAPGPTSRVLRRMALAPRRSSTSLRARAFSDAPADADQDHRAGALARFQPSGKSPLALDNTGPRWPEEPGITELRPA